MTNLDKKEIVRLILQEKNSLGSSRKVANRCDVSPATISQMVNENWQNIADEMWQKVATALNYNRAGWQIAETTNYKMVNTVLNDARYERMFMAISHKAGSGKSATINHYKETDTTGNVFVIQAREWSRREFLLNLCKVLGIHPGNGYVSVDNLGQKVIKFLLERQDNYPLLVIDEADKLRPSALRYIIPLYNELEDKAGIVISGTDNLEKEIKQGVQYNKKGYDELDSRFGRNFIHLIGATLSDVKAICEANGINDHELQKAIFQDASPVRKNIKEHFIQVVEDLRRVKRAIKSNLLKIKHAA